jgi:hypothetical protein
MLVGYFAVTDEKPSGRSQHPRTRFTKKMSARDYVLVFTGWNHTI